MESDQFATYVTFTIQNVPIKFKTEEEVEDWKRTLQYKMFLLNTFSAIFRCVPINLYNTKCSY